MKKNKNKLYIVLIMLISWIFLLITDKEAFKKYLPASIFMSMLVYMESLMAEKLNWWKITTKLIPNLNGNLPFVVGPFLSGSLWILKFTYKNLFLYIIVNFIVDTMFVYPFYTIFKRLGIWKLIKINQFQLSLLFFGKSMLMYIFQRYIVDPLQEKSKE